MAESFPSLTGGLIPQHRDHDIPVPSYTQSYDFSSGYNDLQYLTHHYAFAPQAQQQSLSSGQRSSPQHAQYQYPYPVGGVSAASYMGNPGAMFDYGPTGTRAVSTCNMNSIMPSSVSRCGVSVRSGSLSEECTPIPLAACEFFTVWRGSTRMPMHL
jgi:hypothetical protein